MNNSTDIFEEFKSSDKIKCFGQSEEYSECSDYPHTLFTFDEAVEYEKQMQPLADHFYKDLMGAHTIKRYDWNNKEGRFMQKLDVDCSIELFNPNVPVGPVSFWLNFSEKFRQIDCGDMCIELWSDYKSGQSGWAVKNNAVDYYLYTTPLFFFEVCAGPKFKKMISEITNEWTYEKIGRVFNDDENNGSKDITVGGHNASLIKVWTGERYYGICICIPWKTLLNEYLLDINMYKHNGEKLDINTTYAD